MATSKGTGTTTGIPVKGGKISTAPAPAKKVTAATIPARPARPAAKTATAVATRPTTAVANRAPVGRGFEEADKDSYSIPFVFILQDNSPQLDTVDGAEAGMLFNSATGSLMRDAIVVPVLYRRRFVRWGARDTGGGFKGEFQPSQVDDMLSDGTVKQLPADEGGGIFFVDPQGNANPKRADSLRDTRSHFVLIDGKPCVIAMASTQVKKSKNWMTAMREAGGDMWDHAYAAGSVREQNDKGKWYGWTIAPSAEEVADEWKESAASLYDAIVGGAAAPDYEHAAEGAAEG